MSDYRSIELQISEESISDLWRYYDEHAAQARQHEALRATVTTLLAGFAATMVGIAAPGGFEHADILPGLLIIALGLLGALLSLKHYERNRFHVTVLEVTREKITDLRRDTAPDAARMSTQAIRDEATARHGSSALVRARLYLLWLALPAVIVISGVVVVVLAST
jgi:hypothetical protein